MTTRLPVGRSGRRETFHLCFHPGVGDGDDIRHPIFARMYRRLAARAEPLVGEHRRELLAGLAGRVVEVGAGTGLNFAHYPPAVEEVVAVEPEPTMRAAAREAAGSAPVPVTVVPGRAEALPGDDGSFDAAVTALVLCSVADQPRALDEIRRVLRPGGELRFYEHVRAENAAGRLVQQAADPLWSRLLGGCHPDRDTLAALRGAGLEVDRVRRLTIRTAALAAPHILGVARRR
jgi:SAM-dependent methyltransferase